jgi:phospholipid/cholesterol/gamma-HCH transport system substrate-binding protein
MRRRNEVLVGILLVIALVLGIVGTIWLSRGSLRSGYPLYTVFPWGAGLRQGQPVVLAGVNIGYVDDVALRRNGTLFVRMRIHKEYQIPIGSQAAVQAVGFFGDQQIALLVKSPSDSSLGILGDTIPAAPLAPTIADQLSRVDTIGRAVSDIVRALNVQMIQAGGVADLRKSMAELTRFTARLTAIATEQSDHLTETMASLRKAVSSIDSAVVDSTIRNFRQASTNLTNLTTELKQPVAQIEAILDNAQHGNGSLQKLLNDTAAYDRLMGLIARLDSLLADLQKNPRKYLKFSIF